MSGFVRASTWRRLIEGGFLGLNGLMAAVCGLSALVIGLCVAGALALFLVTIFAAHPGANWQWNSPTEKAGLHVHAQGASGSVSTKTCTIIDGVEKCQISTRPIRPDEVKPDPVGRILQVLDTSVYLAPLAILTYGLTQASACFVNLARRRYFDRVTVRRLRNFAVCGLIYLLWLPHAEQIAGGLNQGIDAVLNRLHPAWVADHGSDKWSFASAGVLDALPILYALMLTVIAAVMTKAASIAEDHAQIV